MSDELQGKRIAIIATDGVEQVELEKPRDAVTQAGATTQLLSIDTGEIQAAPGTSILPTAFPTMDESRMRALTTTTA